MTDQIAEKLASSMQRLMQSGPHRVLVTADEAVSSLRARRDYGVNPVIVFIRNDAWMLAAPKHLEKAAHQMWRDEWIGFARKPNAYALPIEEYRA